MKIEIAQILSTDFKLGRNLMRKIQNTSLSLGLIFVALSVGDVSAAQRKPLTARARENAGLPMRFEENAGQTDGQVRFISRGPGYVLFLTSDEALFKLSGPTPTLPTSWSRLSMMRDRRSNLSSDGGTKSSVLRMRMEGATGAHTITGVDKLPGSSNYLIGKDPNKWHTGVASYAKVRYSEIYSGIDLVYYGTGNRVEYDFIVKPSADPKQIVLSFDGAEMISRDTISGDVSIKTSAGMMALRKPVLYQMEKGQKRLVEGNYKFQGNDRLEFDVREYDHSEPLVIDPVLAYSTYIGGSNWDEADGIAVDANGNAYITGATVSSDYPVEGTSISSAPPTGGTTGFVSKINASGTALLYSTYIGGSSGNDWGWAIAVDGNGFAYITGATASTDFPVTSTNAYQTTFGSGAVQNAFVVKLSADGQSLLYSTYLGGDTQEWGNGIAVDAEENAYITGPTTSSNFPTTPNAIQNSLKSSNGNAFVTRIDTTQNGVSSLVYSTFLGGTSTVHLQEGGQGIAVDSLNNVYVAGVTTSPDFPVTSTAFKTIGPSNSSSGFVSQISTTMSGMAGLTYSTYFGGTDSGSSFDNAFGVALDSSQMVYVSGASLSSDFPTTTGAANGPAGKAFVAKFDMTKSNGDSLVYSTLIGGASILGRSFDVDSAGGVAVDATGNAYLAGYTYDPNFPTTVDAIQSTLGDLVSSFLTVVNQDASSLLYSTYWGGSGSSWSYALALDPSNNIYIPGLTLSPDFETTAGSIQTTMPGAGDGFVAEFTALPVPMIHLLSPSCGTSGADVKIKGLNFGPSQEGSSVKLGGETAPIVSWSDTAIVARVPPFAPTGLLQMTVTTALESSSSEAFMVLSSHDEWERPNRLDCDEHHRKCADLGANRGCGRGARKIRTGRSESTN
jgi:hypothetical protein